MVEVELTLYAISDPITTSDLRTYWKADEAPEVVAAMTTAPSLRLGTTCVSQPDNENARGPVGRVEDTLQRIGTSTWPPVGLPIIDEELTAALLAAFQPQESDPPFDVATTTELADFLAAHRGAGLAYADSRPAERA